MFAVDHRQFVKSLRAPWLFPWSLGVLAVLPVLAAYRAYLSPYTMPMRGGPERPGEWGDLTSLFGGMHLAAIQLLYDEGAFPTWSRFLHGGEPLFAMPATAVVGLGTALAAVLPYPVSLKVDILAHLVMAAAGWAALARALGSGTVVAVLCGALGVVNPYYQLHFHRGHLNFINGFAYAPWLMLLLWRGLRGTRAEAVACGLGMGVLGALAVYDGADVVLLYAVLAVGLMWLAGVATSAARETNLNALALAATAACTAGTLAAFRLLPMLEYMRISYRREGVPWAVASSPGEVLAGPAVNVIGLVMAGAALAAWRLHRGLLLGAAAAGGLGYAAAHHLPTFRLLFDYVPLMNAQRHPQRAEVMLVLTAPVLWALGAGALRALPGRWRHLQWVLAAGMAWSVGQHVRSMPQPLPAVDARTEPRDNPLMRKARASLGDQRLHAVESVDRHWGFEHVSIPNGVETLTGTLAMWQPEFLSPQFYIPHQVAFLDAMARRPARIWGLMSVGLVSSMRPLSHPGLTFLEKLPACGVCQPAKSAGPYVYRNDEALPPMYTVDGVILLEGTGREADLWQQALLTDDAWDPRRTVIARSGVRGVTATPQQRAWAQLILSHASVPPPEGSLPVVRVSGTAVDDGVRAVLRSLARANAPLQAVPQQRDGTTYRGCPTAGRALVVTSKFALTGGWHATDDSGANVPLSLANGVVTAVPLDDTQGCITFRYRPASLVWGAAITFASLPVWLGLAVRLRRRGR